MRLSGDAYSKRLESLSDYAIILLSKCQLMTKDTVYNSLDIIGEPNLNDEQVIDKLTELISNEAELFIPLSYDTLLQVLCDGIEHGYFSMLYDYLEEKAVLELLDEGKSIVGKRYVLEFFLKKRRECFDDEHIMCDVMKVAEGARYGIGEKCILITYPFENEKNQYHLLKVYDSNSKIYKLELYQQLRSLILVEDEEDLNCNECEK